MSKGKWFVLIAVLAGLAALLLADAGVLPTPIL